MKNSAIENKLKGSKGRTGAYIYALYFKDAVVHVGQCSYIQSQIDAHSCEQEIHFDRFTYTFMEGAKVYSEEANLMEVVAISRLMPSLPKLHKAEVKVASERKVLEEQVSLYPTGRIVYQLLKSRSYLRGRAATLLTLQPTASPV